MAVQARAPNRAIFHLRRLLYSNVNTNRVKNWTIVPKMKAMATDRNIPMITDRAFSVLSRSPIARVLSGAMILNSATTNVAPSSSNTIDTVVDVGIPRELNMSSNIMSVTITAMNMVMTS